MRAHRVLAAGWRGDSWVLGIPPGIQLSPPGLFSLQRGTMRRRYEDDGISDDEIEGKRTFDLEEKLSTNKFNSTFVIFMEGKGLCCSCGLSCCCL